MSKWKDNPEGYAEQVRSMRNEGKTYAEVRQFFKETYGIKLYDGQIAKIMRGVKVSKLPREKGRKRFKAAGPRSEGECTFKTICKFAEICRPEICKFKGA